MRWLAFAALFAGVLPLVFMSVGYHFLARRRQRALSSGDDGQRENRELARR